MLLGLGVAYLFIRDARAAKDRTFFWMAVMILVSYACYIPVILFVQQTPMVGMLMIPKTLAYLGIAVIAYRDLFGQAGLVAQGTYEDQTPSTVEDVLQATFE
jgi:hypothetical protein